jgi:peptidoglycan/xylan/chitin deacetylase (PgdA/CDA1 family)
MIGRVCSTLAVLALTVGPSSAAARTIVSLEFDHATSDQLPGIAVAADHGMPVTLFALSGRVGTPGYMTIAQLQALQAAGDEIGGHTIDHQDLSRLSPAAQRQEICGDREALEADGLDVTDFAYPYGHFDAATQGIVRGCGYQSARGTGGLASAGGCFGSCPAAEGIPPANPFDTRTVDSVLDTTPLSTIEAYVIHAERRGGWVQIVFHHVCDRCDTYAVSVPTLTAFLGWLAARSARGTVVQTVRRVIETPFEPSAVWALRTAARSRMLANRRCPATPVTAVCTTIPGRSMATAIPVRSDGLVWLATSASAESVRLLAPAARAVPGRRARRRGLWTLNVGTARRGTATVAVRYPLGVADYPIRLVPPRAGGTGSPTSSSSSWSSCASSCASCAPGAAWSRPCSWR